MHRVVYSIGGAAVGFGVMSVDASSSVPSAPPAPSLPSENPSFQQGASAPEEGERVRAELCGLGRRLAAEIERQGRERSEAGEVEKRRAVAAVVHAGDTQVERVREMARRETAQEVVRLAQNTPALQTHLDVHLKQMHAGIADAARTELQHSVRTSTLYAALQSEAQNSAERYCAERINLFAGIGVALYGLGAATAYACLSRQ